MDRITLALLCGLGFAVATALIMMIVPVPFPTAKEKRDAIVAAFVGRFMLGLVIPLVDLGLPPVVSGLVIGFGFSLHTAMTAKRYPPILITGTVGGAVVGWISAGM